MKKIKYVLLIFLVFLSINVKAANACESSEFSRLKELARKVEFDYDYELVDNQAVFSINASNLNKDLMVLIIEDYYMGKYREFSGDPKGTLTGFSEGEKVVVTIKGFVPNGCSGKTVTTKVVKLPYYNPYYSEEICNGYEDFKYCKPLISREITEQEFNRQFDSFKEKKEAQKTPIPEEPKQEVDNTKLYIIIGGGLVLIIMITIVVMSIIKRRRRNML